MQKQYKSVSPSDDITVKTENGPQPKKHRYIRKEGSCNVVFRHVPEEWLLFVTDIFTTLVEIRWRVMFLIFALSYILSWLFFGILFWVIALTHGDARRPSEEHCVYEVRSFTAAFLFSLETQTTIGYGFRGMSENCMIAIIIVTIQDVISCFIDTFVIGIVVAKMASARKRAQTVGFSNSAVINLRDGYLTLSWRVGDFRRHHLVEGTACAQIVRTTVHATGKRDVTYEDLVIQQRDIIVATPTTIFHRIQPGSPLYKMSLEDLRKSDFELVVSFTYTDDSTGILHQTRTSYTPPEILWGHLFQEMIRVTRRHYTVDYTLFNHTAKVLVPVVSAEEYERQKRLRPSPRHSPRHSPRCSPRHSPRSSPRPSPKQQQNHQEKLLTPPTVTVEMVNNSCPEPTVSTSAENQHQDTLTLPNDLTNTEI
ncbi:inward rectifier potassium channel 16 [Epinephelus fuscoguttatus]|uniref:inward rectifier potassium channel 16 n=1 Tax=Epinephelus fuscoguttatus TaxID=293821 RepID=UPI0020D079F2|nr:inward rectifier potassium channel 16 [Epinephelus fuscoguttatus]XP_049419323.1 inward rectifier potassium channel 16 [Epinephelus fuscoguttatus]XP_049419324.1 inward rectifier potassium channel 16 [Epinephelus fuscoguttatus]XP_049419325.1 inward rectifier potassium channel 16 [Epinephelus fuscoguttatus]XP_049419326.1 inward rectifier potassium channel 16 [Epinephelus fuscoguttatus]XP_049419327.1 inward rectifier potassium channel 16 [Epinephelus fuscoguttatus]